MCDEAARLLQEPGAPCYEPMLALFGRDTLLENGRFDRKQIAKRVFADHALLERLNGIVHPAVKRYVEERLEELRREGCALAVIEAALLLEEHYELICDEIWYVYAPAQARRQRLRESRGYSEEKITQMMAAQLPDGFFREHCQFVVDNSRDRVENTYEQIDKGLKEHGLL